MAKPIKPEDVEKLKKAQIPNEVIEAFNELIAENWTGSSSTVYQKDVVNRILKKFNHPNPKYMEKRIFNKKWLDVEKIFINAGWKVKYDKPAYCESYSAYFRFTR